MAVVVGNVSINYLPTSILGNIHTESHFLMFLIEDPYRILLSGIRMNFIRSEPTGKI